jgi:hypothetical protein
MTKIIRDSNIRFDVFSTPKSKQIQVNKQIRSDLSSNKNLAMCDVETLKYGSRPIGKSLIRSRSEMLKKRAKKGEAINNKWNDRIKCDTCGKEYSRSNQSAHRKTQYHKIYANVGDKVKKILLDN